MTWQSLALDSLRPPREVLSSSLPAEYIFSGVPGDRLRKIFMHVTWQPDEEEMVARVTQEIRQEGITLPPWWTPATTLLYVYCGKFDLATSMADIRLCLSFHQNIANSTLTPEVLGLL